MSKAIYLFKEHENFQPGKSKLQKKAVFTRSIVWIVFGLPISLALIWFGGGSLRQAWRYSQTGAVTTGEISIHYGSSESCTIHYNYEINGISYSAEDVSSQACLLFEDGQQIPVYYLSDNPSESAIEAFVKFGDWFWTIILEAFGLLGILACFDFLRRNRREQIKYARLSHSGKIIETRVRSVETTDYGYKKKTYQLARFAFIGEKLIEVESLIRSDMQYPWPKDIQKGDTLHLLFLDDETYCVL